jgi:phage terminase small subunit
LLTNANVQAFVSKALADRSKRTEITADFVLQSLKEVALRCMNKTAVLEWDYENRCMSQKKDEDGNDVWEFDSAGANKALELLGRHLALFVDRKELKADISIKSVEVKVISTGQPKITSEKDIK